MTDKTFGNAFTLLWQGIKMLTLCTYRWCKHSMNLALYDTLRGIWHHPIVAFIIIGTMALQAYYVTDARMERDRLNKKLYKTEVTRDSALTFCKDTINFEHYYKNEQQDN